MALVDLNITGATYESRSAPLSSQITRNFYPEVQDNEAALSKFVLQSFPGLKLFGTASGTNRGLFEHAGTLYKVTGTTLYTVDSSGTHTNAGSIPGTGKCIFAPLVSDIVIVTGGRAFVYDGSVTEVTDSDLEPPNGAAHLNNQILYDGDNSRFGVSDVGDATSIAGTNYASAESDADVLQRVYTFDQVAYMMGTETIEPWFNSGVGKPPFDRIQGGIMQVGLSALRSASNNQRFLYFLGNDNHVHRIQGTSEQRITPFPIAREIGTYTEANVSAATGFCFSIAGQEFYQVNFNERSFCFHENSGKWFETGEDGARHLADDAVRAFRKTLVNDYSNGNIYELDLDTFDRNGSVLTRERITGPLHGGMIGAPGKEIEVNRFELLMEKGVGGPSVTDPQVMLQVSNDGGRTWSTEMWATVGPKGQYEGFKVEWGPLGTFESVTFRIKTSDAVQYSIHSAAADIEALI